MTTTTAPAAPTTRDAQLKPARVAIAAAVALALNLAAYGIGTLAGASWTVSSPVGISWVGITATTLGTMAVGGLITWLLVRSWTKAPTWAAWGGLIFGLASMPMSFIAAADLTTGFGLASMHVIAALAWFFAVRPAKA
ncbi:MAG TPA: DUF6069 family protein [Propionicimonas sp.]|jgi:hypothetical protein|uniref:DUF6069 family protein n=1 Tax=Propionicimonas sp. TaxID=1955623 RepID=UPI002F3E5A9C